MGGANGGGPGRSLPARSRELRRARPVGGRSRPAVPRLRFLVAHRLRRRRSRSEWGTPRHVRERAQPRPLLVKGDYGHRLHMWDLRKRRHLQDNRPRRGESDGARTAARARSDQGLRLRLRRHLDQGSSAPDLAVASRERQRQMGGAQGDRDSRRARRPAICCRRRSSSSRPRRRWSPKSRSASTTSFSTLHAGAPANSSSMT